MDSAAFPLPDLGDIQDLLRLERDPLSVTVAVREYDSISEWSVECGTVESTVVPSAILQPPPAIFYCPMVLEAGMCLISTRNNPSNVRE